MSISEETMLVNIRGRHISAKPLFKALRNIRDKVTLVQVGIEHISSSDKFVLHLFSEHTYPGTGTLNTFPQDIMDFYIQLNEIKQQSNL